MRLYIFSKSVILPEVVLLAFLMVIQEEHIQWDLPAAWQISTVIFVFQIHYMRKSLMETAVGDGLAFTGTVLDTSLFGRCTE